LIERLTQLPGIGQRSAERIARYILKQPIEETRKLSLALVEARDRIGFCTRCGNLTEEELCNICTDASRHQALICVVEEAFDISVIERAGVYSGLYHVLGGVLSPLEDISPAQLRISELLKRVMQEKIDEVILATSATTEGEITASYIAQELAGKGVRVTRIARGIPVGTDLGLADEVTISKALRGREKIIGGAED